MTRRRARTGHCMGSQASGEPIDSDAVGVTTVNLVFQLFAGILLETGASNATLLGNRLVVLDLLFARPLLLSVRGRTPTIDLGVAGWDACDKNAKIEVCEIVDFEGCGPKVTNRRWSVCGNSWALHTGSAAPRSATS